MKILGFVLAAIGVASILVGVRRMFDGGAGDSVAGIEIAFGAFALMVSALIHVGLRSGG